MNVGTRYLDYMVPGIIMLTAGYGVGVTAVGMATDVAEGVVNRFRTMAISRASVPTGQSSAAWSTTLAGIVVVLGVTVVMGFRPNATPVEWLAAIGLIVLLVLAITWLAVALALAAPNAEAANFYTFPACVPPVPQHRVRAGGHDDRRSALVRGEPAVFEGDRDAARSADRHPDRRQRMVGGRLVRGIALVGYLWARALFNREPRP